MSSKKRKSKEEVKVVLEEVNYSQGKSKKTSQASAPIPISYPPVAPSPMASPPPVLVSAPVAAVVPAPIVSSVAPKKKKHHKKKSPQPQPSQPSKPMPPSDSQDSCCIHSIQISPYKVVSKGPEFPAGGCTPEYVKFSTLVDKLLPMDDFRILEIVSGKTAQEIYVILYAIRDKGRDLFSRASTVSVKDATADNKWKIVDQTPYPIHDMLNNQINLDNFIDFCQFVGALTSVIHYNADFTSGMKDLPVTANTYLYNIPNTHGLTTLVIGRVAGLFVAQQDLNQIGYEYTNIKMLSLRTSVFMSTAAFQSLLELHMTGIIPVENDVNSPNYAYPQQGSGSYAYPQQGSGSYAYPQQGSGSYAYPQQGSGYNPQFTPVSSPYVGAFPPYLQILDLDCLPVYGLSNILLYGAAYGQTSMLIYLQRIDIGVSASKNQALESDMILSGIVQQYQLGLSNGYTVTPTTVDVYPSRKGGITTKTVTNPYACT